MGNAPTTRKLTDAEARLAEIFAMQQSAGAPQLAKLRTAAFDAFSKTGLPNRRDEAWKYTDLRALLRDVKPLARRRKRARSKARGVRQFLRASRRGASSSSAAISFRSFPILAIWKQG